MATTTQYYLPTGPQITRVDPKTNQACGPPQVVEQVGQGYLKSWCKPSGVPGIDQCNVKLVRPLTMALVQPQCDTNAVQVLNAVKVETDTMSNTVKTTPVVSVFGSQVQQPLANGQPLVRFQEPDQLVRMGRAGGMSQAWPPMVTGGVHSPPGYGTDPDSQVVKLSAKDLQTIVPGSQMAGNMRLWDAKNNGQLEALLANNKGPELSYLLYNGESTVNVDSAREKGFPFADKDRSMSQLAKMYGKSNPVYLGELERYRDTLKLRLSALRAEDSKLRPYFSTLNVDLDQLTIRGLEAALLTGLAAANLADAFMLRHMAGGQGLFEKHFEQFRGFAVMDEDIASWVFGPLHADGKTRGYGPVAEFPRTRAYLVAENYPMGPDPKKGERADEERIVTMLQSWLIELMNTKVKDPAIEKRNRRPLPQETLMMTPLKNLPNSRGLLFALILGLLARAQAKFYAFNTGTPIPEMYAYPDHYEEESRALKDMKFSLIEQLRALKNLIHADMWKYIELYAYPPDVTDLWVKLTQLELAEAGPALSGVAKRNMVNEAVAEAMKAQAAFPGINNGSQMNTYTVAPAQVIQGSIDNSINANGTPPQVWGSTAAEDGKTLTFGGADNRYGGLGGKPVPEAIGLFHFPPGTKPPSSVLFGGAAGMNEHVMRASDIRASRAQEKVPKASKAPSSRSGGSSRTSKSTRAPKSSSSASGRSSERIRVGGCGCSIKSSNSDDL